MASNINPKTIAVLKYIAQGYSYEQILAAYPDLSYLDIFNAAKDSLEIMEADSIDTDRVAEIRQTHPRAYEKWEEVEDAELKALFTQGVHAKDIARKLQRQQGAITSRLRKLGLIAE